MDSRKQAHPVEASPVGSGIAGELTHPSDDSSQIPKTEPGRTPEMSELFLTGFPGFCDYAKWRLQVETQIWDFVVRLLLLGALSRSGSHSR